MVGKYGLFLVKAKEWQGQWSGYECENGCVNHALRV